MDHTDTYVEYGWEAEQDEPPSLGLIPFTHAVLNKMECQDHTVSILITSDEEVRALNKQFRKKDRATDVLSFPSLAHNLPDVPQTLGDIVISAETAARQAHEIGQSLTLEIRFLVLHGLLHLMGYDHETDDGEMLALQTQLKQELAPFFEQES